MVGKSQPLLFDPLSHLLSSSLPNSATDSVEGSGPVSRRGGETGVKTVQQAKSKPPPTLRPPPFFSPSPRHPPKNNYGGLKWSTGADSPVSSHEAGGQRGGEEEEEGRDVAQIMSPLDHLETTGL